MRNLHLTKDQTTQLSKAIRYWGISNINLDCAVVRTAVMQSKNIKGNDLYMFFIDALEELS